MHSSASVSGFPECPEQRDVSRVHSVVDLSAWRESWPLETMPYWLLPLYLLGVAFLLDLSIHPSIHVIIHVIHPLMQSFIHSFIHSCVHSSNIDEVLYELTLCQ